MSRRRQPGAIAGTALSVILCGAAAFAQAEAFFSRAAGLDVQEVPVGTAGAKVELPKRDWRVSPARDGDSVVTAEQRRREAAIFVDAVSLEQPLASEDVTELLGELELERLQESNPEGQDFEVRMFRVGERRVAVVQFTRPVTRGRERVRQYSYPDGLVLYRLTCTASVDRFLRYEPIFAHVAASFRVGAS
jgi:hypothetical protein